jgi:prepilin-type N-terminal cleavage/methylation domain-containing protein
MNHNCRSSRRDGVSLIELLVVMSATSIILSLSAGLIHRIMHAESKARSLGTIERTSLRLANTFRRDVHDASNAITDRAQLTDGAFVRLNSSGGKRIEYRREQRVIRRIQLDGERIVVRDEFAFPTDFEMNLQYDGSRLLVLAVSSQKENPRNESPREESRSDKPIDPVRLAHALTVNLEVAAALGRGAP